MTSGDQSQGGRAQDEILAGEYVLGVLPQEARRRVEQRMARDKAFARIVHRWRSELASFKDDEDVFVNAPLALGSIERRLMGMAYDVPPTRTLNPGLWHSVRAWRWTSLGAGVIAVVAVIYAVRAVPPALPPVPALVAELAAVDQRVDLLASYDAGSGRLKVVPVAAQRPDAKVLQLWLMPKTGAARSLGIFRPESGGEIVVPIELRGGLAEGATLAVSVEPSGGSPTGLPTGQVVASGAARRL
jgi:anti-sigma-K factor RskA